MTIFVLARGSLSSLNLNVSELDLFSAGRALGIAQNLQLEVNVLADRRHRRGEKSTASKTLF